jgi:hypothetical protein
MEKQSLQTRVVVKASDKLYKVTKLIQEKFGKEPPFMTERVKGGK